MLRESPLRSLYPPTPILPCARYQYVYTWSLIHLESILRLTDLYISTAYVLLHGSHRSDKYRLGEHNTLIQHHKYILNQTLGSTSLSLPGHKETVVNCRGPTSSYYDQQWNSIDSSPSTKRPRSKSNRIWLKVIIYCVAHIP